MYEKTYEFYLCRLVEELGGECIKLTGIAGLPDRMVLLPGGRIIFVEMKREGFTPRPIQKHWLRKLRALGFKAGWCDSYESVERLISLCQQGYGVPCDEDDKF